MATNAGCIEAHNEDYVRVVPSQQISLTEAVRAATRALFEVARTRVALQGMRTSCSALLVPQGFASLAHVGGSRLFLVRYR